MKSTLADFGILMCSSDEKTLNVFPYDKRDCFMRDICTCSSWLSKTFISLKMLLWWKSNLNTAYITIRYRSKSVGEILFSWRLLLNLKNSTLIFWRNLVFCWSIATVNIVETAYNFNRLNLDMKVKSQPGVSVFEFFLICINNVCSDILIMVYILLSKTNKGSKFSKTFHHQSCEFETAYRLM